MLGCWGRASSTSPFTRTRYLLSLEPFDSSRIWHIDDPQAPDARADGLDPACLQEVEYVAAEFGVTVEQYCLHPKYALPFSPRLRVENK